MYNANVYRESSPKTALINRSRHAAAEMSRADPLPAIRKQVFCTQLGPARTLGRNSWSCQAQLVCYDFSAVSSSAIGSLG